VTRGDLYRVRLGRGRGHEQAGSRFGVIVQADEFLSRSIVIIAPTSTRAFPATFRPEIRISGTTTRVMIDQLRCVDVERFGKRVRRLTREEMREVDDALRVVLDL
jgi:mRNA interferase MazF